MTTTASEIRWEVLPRARTALDQVRESRGAAAYDAEKTALRQYLCGYFNSGTCRHKQGDQISPMRSTFTASGGKCLKVRWGLPGGGKSGGLRLAVVVYCEQKHVKICGAWLRREDPSDADFDAATMGG